MDESDGEEAPWEASAIVDEVLIDDVSDHGSMPDLVPLQEDVMDEEWIRLMMPASSPRPPLLSIFGDFYRNIYPSFYEWFPQGGEEADWNLHIVDVVAPPAPIQWLSSDEPVVKERCPICYSRRFRKMQRTDCGHLFCQTCCRTHFDRARTCPMCRADVSQIWLCPTVLTR
jgi:hypothetical protein